MGVAAARKISERERREVRRSEHRPGWLGPGPGPGAERGGIQLPEAALHNPHTSLGAPSWSVPGDTILYIADYSRGVFARALFRMKRSLLEHSIPVRVEDEKSSRRTLTPFFPKVITDMHALILMEKQRGWGGRPLRPQRLASWKVGSSPGRSCSGLTSGDWGVAEGTPEILRSSKIPKGYLRCI